MLRSAVSFGRLSDPGPGAGAASLYVRLAVGLQAPFGRAAFHMQATPLARLHGPQRFDGAVRTGDLGLGALHFSLGGRVEATEPACEHDAYGRADFDLRVGSVSPAQGISSGVSLVRSSTPTASLSAPTARIAGWIRRLGISFSGEVTTTQVASGSRSSSGSGPTDSLAFDRFRGDTARATIDTPIVLNPPLATGAGTARALMATEARFTLASRVVGVDVDAVGGAFPFTIARNAPYGSFTLTRWLTSDAAVTAGFVQRVLDPVRGTSVRMAMLGIRMALRGAGGPSPSICGPACITFSSGSMTAYGCPRPGSRGASIPMKAAWGWLS
jgi:hypothetical protein